MARTAEAQHDPPGRDQAMTDPIKRLLKDTDEELKELEWWIGTEVMPELIRKLEDGGVETEDIPKLLIDYAKWMAANMELWNDDRPIKGVDFE